VARKSHVHCTKSNYTSAKSSWLCVNGEIQGSGNASAEGSLQDTLIFWEAMMAKETGARARLKEVESSAATMLLSKFIETIDQKCNLSRRDRLRIVQQALLLLEMNYVHLPLKRAMHAIDPIQRLRLLRFRLMEAKETDLQNGMLFHRRLLEIFSSTRDLHTTYLLPEPFVDRLAFLPFLIEQYFEQNGKVEKFLVTRVVTEYLQRPPDSGREVELFEPGVEALYWNGVPIPRAIAINGEAQAGSNLEARFARGLDNLTIRPLQTSMPPDESWVALTYRARNGEILTLKQEWSVYTVGDTAVATKATIKKRAAIDIKKTKINQLKKKLYVDRKVKVDDEFADIFYAEVKKVDNRDFGYIRLFSFDVENPEEFVDELRRVITSPTFPQEGLIIDVRGNPGGKIRAGERLLQLFTPRRIQPELFEFINTPLNLEICRLAPKHWNLARWANSIAESVVTGATYSAGFPLNSEESCNDIGQVYHGPVILITDALSYSTTDIFAAGFQDNEIGEVLGTSDNTGAGGANVWWYEDLMDAVRATTNSPFKPLPKGADLMVAVRRSIRVGRQAGRPLEELGIAPDHRHQMTKRDVLKANDDLIKRAARILERKPIYSLSVKASAWKDGSRTVVMRVGTKIKSPKKVQYISRLDIYVAGRPYKSFDARDGSLSSRKFTLKRNKGRNNLLVQAFDGANNLVAAYRHD
jgi:C-terminal processing protease CtpA/Prc